MAFEPAIDFEYSHLDQETKYRFAELELKHFLDQHPFGNEYAFNLLLTRVFNDLDEEETSLLTNVTKSHLFNRPRKSEYVDYFRYCSASYQKITALTGISSRTIAKRRFEFPFYTPVFIHWTEEHLQKWNSFKDFYNIWQEELIQKNAK